VTNARSIGNRDMQSEPIQFDAGSSSWAKWSAAGFASGHRMQKSVPNLSIPTVLDEAFAEYSRIDAGTSTNNSAPAPRPTNWRAAPELIASISTQLKYLDSQRRQLRRLLESVETDAAV
jgi:hypothetical protein